MKVLLRRLRHFLHNFSARHLPLAIKRKMINCEQVARSLEQESPSKLSFKLKARIHTLLCQDCTDYQRQLSIIHKASRKLGTLELTSEQKQRLIQSKKETLKKFIA